MTRAGESGASSTGAATAADALGGAVGWSELNSLTGDALVFVGMLCWAIYSVGSRPLLGRYSPTVLTAWTTLIGAALYVVVALPTLAGTNWAGVSSWSWFLMASSITGAHCFAIKYGLLWLLRSHLPFQVFLCCNWYPGRQGQ